MFKDVCTMHVTGMAWVFIEHTDHLFLISTIFWKAIYCTPFMGEDSLGFTC